MYIAYDVKDGAEYAKLCVSRRSGKSTFKDYINLGRVLYSRVCKAVGWRPEFALNKPKACSKLPSSSRLRLEPPRMSGTAEKPLLDFGDAFFIRSGVYCADHTIDKFPYRTRRRFATAPEQWGLLRRRSKRLWRLL